MRSSQAFAIAAAGTLLLLASPALAQQRPSGEGTSADGPITIIKNMVPLTVRARVAVDGHEVSHLNDAAYADITTSVHNGQNTVTVTWDAPVTRLDFKIAYAATRNNFKNVLVVNDDASTDPALRRPGARTLTFTIPG